MRGKRGLGTKGLPNVSPRFKLEVLRTPYPYLLEDSSMTSRRFSLMEASMELNFCFTCFNGSLCNTGGKTSHAVNNFTLFSFFLPSPSSSPHVRQELLQLLLPVDGPKLEAARGVAGVADALVQGPVLVEGQTEAENRQSGENGRVALQTKTMKRAHGETKDREDREGYSYSKEILMQSMDRELSSSSFRWLCRETCRCIVAMSVTYFMLKEEKKRTSR